jgi:dTDP-glucose 4,6-dehydratase
MPGFTEQSPYRPNSPYAATKAAADHLVRAYHATFGMDVTISNCSNNFGPYQLPEKFIPLMLVNALRGRPLPVYGDGENVRDWLFVTEHCRGIERILELGQPGQTYNIGLNCEMRNIDLVRRLCAQLDARFAANTALARRFPEALPAVGRHSAELIAFVADRPGHDRRYAIDASRLHDELGFDGKKSFDDALAATIDWYLDNPGWWEPLLDRIGRVDYSGAGRRELSPSG